MIGNGFGFRGAIFGAVLVGLLGLAPAARADHWQKSSDGYWYFWSDGAQRWFWLDGRDWYVQQDGGWVKWAPPTVNYTRSYYPPRAYVPSSGGTVRFPYGSVSWGAGGQVTFPYGSVSWGPGGGGVVFPYGSVSWPGRGWRR